MTTPDRSPASTGTTNVLEIEILNHAGVLSHIVGLFARRACSIDGVLCLPHGDGSMSRLWLRVTSQERTQQMKRLVENLVDVISVRLCNERQDLFEALPSLLQQAAEQYQPSRRCFGQMP